MVTGLNPYSRCSHSDRSRTEPAKPAYAENRLCQLVIDKVNILIYSWCANVSEGVCKFNI